MTVEPPKRESLHAMMAARRVVCRKKLLGTEDPRTLQNITTKRPACREEGRWSEAEELEVQGMKARLRILGREHPDTLTRMGRLASKYRSQRRWSQSKKLDLQVMEAIFEILDSEYPSTLADMSNLASTFFTQGRWSDSEELVVQVLEMRKRALGPEHPLTLNSMANLASIRRNHGQWKEAEELEVQVMETSLKILGRGHPSTLTIMARLASIYRNQGRWRDADDLEMQANGRVEQHSDSEKSTVLIISYFTSSGMATTVRELPAEIQQEVEGVIARAFSEDQAMKHLIFGALVVFSQRKVDWRLSLSIKALSEILYARSTEPIHKDLSVFMRHRAAPISRCIRLQVLTVAGSLNSEVMSRLAEILQYREDAKALQRGRPDRLHAHRTRTAPARKGLPGSQSAENNGSESSGSLEELTGTFKGGERLIEQAREYLSSDATRKELLQLARENFFGNSQVQSDQIPKVHTGEETDGQEICARSIGHDDSQQMSTIVESSRISIADSNSHTRTEIGIFRQNVMPGGLPEDISLSGSHASSNPTASTSLDNDQVGFCMSWYDSILRFIERWSESNLGLPIVWWPLEPPKQNFPLGYSETVFFKCACGRTFSGLTESSTGGLPSSAASLSQSSSSQPAGMTGSQSFQPTAGPNTRVRKPAQRTYPSTSGAASQVTGSIQPENLDYVLLCVSPRIKCTITDAIVLPDDGSSRCDRKFFSDLRNYYRRLRGHRWGSFIGFFRVLKEFKFVKLHRLAPTAPTVFCSDEQEIPAVENRKYEYTLDQQTAIPPIPIKFLMHCYENVDHIPEQYNLLKKIPKRRKGPLPNKEDEAWGLQAVDGLSCWRLLVAMQGLLLITVGFVVYWLVKHPGDLQNAFVPPFFMLAVIGSVVVLPPVVDALEN